MEKNSFPKIEIVDRPYIKVYSWENLDLEKWRLWNREHWTLCIYVAIGYIILIHVLQHILQQRRRPFVLTRPVRIWNSVLGIFSIIAFLRTVPEFIYVLSGPNGFHNSVCKWTAHNDASAFWGWWFQISKFVELGDTLFVVFKKQPLRFHHWYHHAIALVGTWTTYSDYEPMSIWTVVMALFVHGVLYPYYVFKDRLGIKVQIYCAKFLTALQLVQMFSGVVIHIYAAQLMWLQGRPQECDKRNSNLVFHLAIYFSYLLIFGRLFWTTYMRPSPFRKKLN